MFITVNISEGDLYKINNVSLAGDFPVKEEIIRSLIYVVDDSTFSQELITFSEESINNLLNNEGFLFSEVVRSRIGSSGSV